MLPPDLTRLLGLGWHLMPVSRFSKAYCIKPDQGYTATDYHSNDPDVVSDWYHRFRDCNWRVHMGASGLLALDIDRESDLHEANGFRTMFHLIEKHGALPDGPRLKTGGSGGCVAFFRCMVPSDELRGSGAMGPGIDIMRGRVCPTVPPSIHQVSGGSYRWYRGHAPWQIDLPEIPDWIMQKIKRPVIEYPSEPVEITDEHAGRLLGYYTQDMRNAPSGASNSTLNTCSFKAGRLVGAGKISYSDAVQALRSAAYERIKPEDRGSIMSVIKAGVTSGMRAT